jgi:hypothetical protein
LAWLGADPGLDGIEHCRKGFAGEHLILDQHGGEIADSKQAGGAGEFVGNAAAGSAAQHLGKLEVFGGYR